MSARSVIPERPPAPCGAPRGGARQLWPGRRAARCAAAFVIVAAVRVPAVSAQEDLRAGCRTAVAPVEVRQFCELAAYAAETMEARAGIASTAGNPVPGTASTFGMRLGSLPRMSLGGRFTVTRIELPPIGRLASNETPDGWLAAFNVDGSVGLFSGLALFPTVGGFLSVDLIGSAGITHLPGSDGFDGGWPVNWGLGARLGITRESFTAPGISVFGMYRRFGGATFGDPALVSTDAFIDLDGISAWSLRGAVGKQLTLIGLTGGVGYDRYAADAELSVDNPGGDTIQLAETGLSTGRLSAFANVSLTLLILTLSGELGWQQGGDTPNLSARGADVPGKSGFFGGIAIRLAI